MTILSSEAECCYLIFEKEPKSGLTIWAVFDIEKRVFTDMGYSENWDLAAQDARKAVESARENQAN